MTEGREGFRRARMGTHCAKLTSVGGILLRSWKRMFRAWGKSNTYKQQMGDESGN